MGAGPLEDPKAQLIEQRWRETIQRFAELRPLLDETRLGVTAKDAAEYLGLETEGALREWLKKRWLPPFKYLRQWYYVVQIVERWERGEAIAGWALARGDNPSVYYKFVESVGRVKWTQLRARGSVDAKQRALSQWTVYDREAFG